MDRTACTELQCLYSIAIPLLPLRAVRPVQSLSACTVQLYFYSPQCLYSRAIPLLPSVPVQYSYTSTPLSACIWLHLYLLPYTHLFHLAPSSREANWFSAIQESPGNFWNQNVRYRSHKCPPPFPILSQLYPVHAPTFHFLKTDWLLYVRAWTYYCLIIKYKEFSRLIQRPAVTQIEIYWSYCKILYYACLVRKFLDRCA